MQLFYFLWFLLLFIPSDALESPTTTPTPEVIEKLQKAKEFFGALKEMSDGFDCKIPARKSIKQIMGGSAKIGPIIFDGFPWSMKDLGVTNYYGMNKEEIDETIAAVSHFEHETFEIGHKIMRRHYALSDRLHIQSTINVIHTFWVMSEHFDRIDEFKVDCKRGFKHLHKINSKIDTKLSAAEALLKADGYSDEMYADLHRWFQNSFKIIFAIYPLCNYLDYNHWQHPTLRQEDSQIIKEFLSNANNRFTKLKADRERLYFSLAIIKKIIIHELLDNFEQSNNGSDLAERIYEKMNKLYGTLNYNYYVIVSNSAKLGYNETLIQCATECHYLYNYFGKDVYVMRARKTEKYQKCDYLEKLQSITIDDNDELGLNSNGTLQSLVPLAKEITENCANIAALSIIRPSLEIQKMHKNNLAGFEEGIIQNANIVIAYYPA